MLKNGSSNGKKSETIFQFIKFGMVGVLNTLISTGIYYIFIYFNDNLYLLGHVVGFLVSVLNAYYFNQKFVFKTKINTLREHMKSLLKTYASYGSTFLLSVFLMWFLVSVSNVSKIIAPFLNLIVTTPINFLFNKFWSFRKK